MTVWIRSRPAHTCSFMLSTPTHANTKYFEIQFSQRTVFISKSYRVYIVLAKPNFWSSVENEKLFIWSGIYAFLTATKPTFCTYSVVFWIIKMNLSEVQRFWSSISKTRWPCLKQMSATLGRKWFGVLNIFGKIRKLPIWSKNVCQSSKDKKIVSGSNILTLSLQKWGCCHFSRVSKLCTADRDSRVRSFNSQMNAEETGWTKRLNDSLNSVLLCSLPLSLFFIIVLILIKSHKA